MLSEVLYVRWIIKDFGLNPCSNGMLSEENVCNSVSTDDFVLILVLMECFQKMYVIEQSVEETLS